MSETLKKLYIEPTSKCNLNCKMCFRNAWTDEAFEDMTPDLFNKIMETMPQSVETVFFGGMGEPLFHKDIIYMVRTASSIGKRVEILTNATLLNGETSRQLLQAGVGRVWISLDSFDDQGYENIRRNGKLDTVLNNIKTFNREKQELKSSATLGLAFVAMKGNLNQLEKIPMFALRNEITEVNISNLLPSDAASTSETLYNRVIDMSLSDEKTAPSYPKINIPMMDWKDKEVFKNVNHLMASSICNSVLCGQPITRKTNFCRFIEEGITFIKHNGNVSPCMALLHTGTVYLGKEKRTVYHHSFGNLYSDRLDFIWRSKEYADFRNRVREFSFSPCIICGGCYEREENITDCYGNSKPTCGACLWSEGVISCP